VSSQILCCFPFAACRNMQTNFLADVLSSATPLSRPMMHIAKVNLAGQLEVALSGDAQDMLPKGMRRPPGLELDLDGVAAVVSGTSRTMRRRRLRQLQKSRLWWRIFHLEEATVGIGGSADVMQQSWNHSWHIAAMTHNTPELGTQTEYVNVPSSYSMVKHNSMNNLLLEFGVDMLPANEQVECGIQDVPDFIDVGVAADVSMKEQSAQTEGISFERCVQTDDFPAPLTNSMDFVYDVGMGIAGDQLLPCSTFAKECHDRVDDAIDEWAYDVYRLHEDAEIAVYKRNGQLIFCSCDSSG